MDKFRTAVILFILLAGQIGGSAGAASAPDSNFAPRLELTGTVVSVAAQADGKVVVAGDFATINGVGRYSLARINTDGTVDSGFTLAGAAAITADYQVVAVQADGKILVGGNFWWVTPEGNFRQYLARLHSDGSLDSGFDAGNYSSNGLNGTVKAVALQADGKILIGGDFTRVRGADRARVARLNADGDADTVFDPRGGANALVRGIAVQGDGKILVAGEFTAFAGTSRGRLARMAVDGALDADFSPSANDAINALAVQSDGRIVIGGDFTAVAGEGRNRLARINPDGSLDGLSTGYFWSVKTVLPLPDNSLVVGGWNPVMIFNGYPTDHDAYLARYGSDGAALGTQRFAGKPTEVLALARRADGNIVAGGSFRNLDTAAPLVYLHGLALFAENLTVAQGFTATVARNGVVSALLDQGNGKVLVAGNFNLVNGQNHPPLVRLNANASIDTTFVAPVIAGAVGSIAALSDGSIAIAGGFDGVAGSLYDRVVHLNSSGAVASTANYNASARALAATADGKVYVGGSADAGFRGVMRLNIADWSIDSTFAVGSGLSNSVAPNRWVDFANAMTLQPDGKLLLVGQFDQFNGASRSNVVRLNTDGSVDAGFIPPTLTTFNPSFPPEVFAVALQADGKVLIGGYFHGYAGGSGSVPGLLRLNADGSADTAFTAGFGNVGDGVKTLLIGADGKILAGGGLQAGEGAVFYNYFVRLNPDGSRDTTLTPSFSGKSVNAMLISGGRILIGGEFYMADSEFRGSLAAYGGGAGSGLSFVPGWNLLGNSIDQAIDVKAVFGDLTTPTTLSAQTTTVWTWDAARTQWAFFAPSMNATQLAAYAQSKGYLVLQSIEPRQGYWVNAKTAGTLPAQAGATLSVTAANLVAGWNLVADGQNLSPTAFHASLGSGGSNFITLWAWDASSANWYFYAPSLESNGTLASYIASKSYLGFGSATLGKGTGFWLNRP